MPSELPTHEDMFLELELSRSGPVEGESVKAGHEGEIEVVGWRWGLQASTAMAGSGPASKSTLNELRIKKRIDRASPILMLAVRNNEPIKRAVLSVRKSGTQGQDYLTIAIEKGRVTALDLGNEGIEASEELALSFQYICVTYQQQQDDGSLGAAVVFEDSSE